MRGPVTSALALAAIVVASVFVAGLASTFALGRPSLGLLDINLASAIRADYSVDPQGIRLAPLDEGIIDDARSDESALRRRGDGGGAGGSDASQTTPTPTSSPVVSHSPGTTATPTPTPGVTPTPTPSPSPTPTPIITPISTPTPIATPTTIVPLPLTLYLHNIPSPPLGDSASHAMLPADAVAPAAALLFNYDTDRDLFPGLVIAKGGLGADEKDTTKFQSWRTSALPAAVRFEGKVTVDLWTAMKGFQTGKRGSATVYLRDFDGTAYKEIAQATVDSSDWQGGALAWTQKSFTLDVGPHTVQAGRRLELKVIVGSDSADDMWFAYDTISQPSRVRINQ